MDYALTVTQVLALMVAGVAYALLGSVKVPLARRLSIDEADIGKLMSLFGFTLIPMALIAGMLCDVIGRQYIFSAGFGLMLIGILMLAQVKKYKSAMVSIFVFGAGWATAVNALNGLQVPAFLHPELRDVTEKIHFAMNLGDFIFGMGAFVAPLLFAFMIRKFGFTKTVVFAGLLSVLPLIIQLGVDWGPLAIVQKVGFFESMKMLLQDPIVWICSIAMFFHFPIEFSVATWSTTLMGERNVSEERAAGYLSAFWLTFLVSRLVIAFLTFYYLPEGYGPMILIGLSLLCTVSTLGLVLSRSAAATCSLVILLGALLGPLFPTLIAVLIGHVNAELGIELQGRAIGLFFCLGGIGCTLIPLLVGSVARKSSLQRGFIYIVFASCALTVLCTTLHFAA